jgi:Phage P22-like portal protein
VADESGLKGDAKLIATARKRFIAASEAESDIRKNALEDLKFFAGDQWPEGIKRQREMDGRPCLTINQLPQFTRQVTNDQRQNRPSIQVNAVNSEADEETADIEQGMIRHIEYDSDADAAYDTGFQSAVIGGYGYFRINTAYSDPMSFEQDIKILRVANPFTIYIDPDAKETDRSDMNFAFAIESMSKDAYKEAYPDSEMSAMEDWTSIGDGWADKDTCRVAEYYYRESITKTIVQLSDGSTMAKDLLEKEKFPKEITVEKERETQLFAVKWVKMNGAEVLERTEWPGKWIPIIPVFGEELDIDGKRVLKGIVRDAREPQQQYNFMASASTEAIALAPKAPYVILEGQLEGHEQEWQTANVKNYAYLAYKGVSLNGTPAPPPQRNVAGVNIQATTEAMMQASNDLKSVTGIQNAALGAPGNETSGRGIEARQAQSQGSNFNFIDNLSRALRHAGRIIIELIPYVYDTPRVLRIIGEDGSQSTVAINTHPNPQAPEGDPAKDLSQIYDMSVGKYDVTISTGPSYQTKRQEAVATQLQLAKVAPDVMKFAPDLVIANMDIPQAQEIAERFKKMLPPQLQDQPGQTQDPAQLQQMLDQMHQQNQQLTAHLNSATQNIQQNLSVQQANNSSKEKVAQIQASTKYAELEIERMRIQATIISAQLAAKVADADANADRQLQLVQQSIDNAHEFAMSQVDHQNSLEAGQQQAGLQSQQSAQDAQQAQQTDPQDSAQSTAQQ